MRFSYAPQPDGLAQAFLIGEDFNSHNDVVLILGNNIFYGDDLSSKLQRARLQSLSRQYSLTKF
ncbi:MAG: glucose-1-phosphate thymidylyltransferase [Hyphomicrobiaceae bacterium]|jgi:glucose-1-phosphate thymidylyltransferase